MRHILPCLLVLLCSTSLSAQVCTTDDFEGLTVGLILNVGTTAIDDTTVIGGQGSGHVEDGCTYTTLGTDFLWWNAPSFLPDQCISATWSPTAQIALEYDNDVATVEVELHGFFADTLDGYAYDAGGGILDVQLGITVVPLGTTTVNFANAGIRKVEFFSGLTGGDGPFIGKHTYCATSGPQLSLSAPCPGPATLSGSGMSPNGQVIVGWSTVQGPWSIPPAFFCGGTSMDIVAPNILMTGTADANGDYSVAVNMPPVACGLVHVQGLDRVSCVPTNVLSL